MQVFRGLVIVIGSFALIIFNSIKDEVQQMSKDVVTIRLDVQQVKDKIDYHGDAINKLDKRQDYLDKYKQDKRKPQPED